MRFKHHWAYVAAVLAGVLLMVHGALAAETIRQGFASLTGVLASALLGFVLALLLLDWGD